MLAEKGETWRWRRMRREEVNVDVKMKEDVQEVTHDKRRLSPLPAERQGDLCCWLSIIHP